MATYLTKENKICKFCKTVAAMYTCPKCNYDYCSLLCYRSKDHVKCSEDFYKEWVVTYLQNEHTSALQKKKMISALKEHKEKIAEDETQSMIYNLEDMMAGLDISPDISDNALWKQLTESEKVEFIECLKKDSLEHVIPLWIPWWTIKEKPKLVEELETASHKKDQKIMFPPIPGHIPKLSLLTSISPADCIKYNLINIIYSYACVTRLYNGEHLDLPEEVMECFLFICPSLSESRNFGSVEEAIFASVHKIVTEQSEWTMTKSEALDIFNDVAAILTGPSEKDPTKYVLCSLADLRSTAKKAKKYLKAQSKGSIDTLKSIMTVSRKMDYFMSWTVEFFIRSDDVISDLELVRLSWIESRIFDQIAQTVKIQQTSKKKLIEEIT